jgi:hypothetical protein
MSEVTVVRDNSRVNKSGSSLFYEMAVKQNTTNKELLCVQNDAYK